MGSFYDFDRKRPLEIIIILVEYLECTFGYTELFEMIVGVLTTCYTQYT